MIAKGTRFSIRVQPRAKKNGITGNVGDAIKVSIAAPATEGRANEACLKFFAELLRLPRSAVTIASGKSSRNKGVGVTGLSSEELHKRLKMQVQKDPSD
jgi:uncharacterized protein